MKFFGAFGDPDGTIKCVYGFGENGKDIVELSYIRTKCKVGLDIICVPTQHFCDLKCKFCHLTTSRQRTSSCRNIESENLKEAIAHMVGLLYDKLDCQPRDTNKLLISFMGVGDPVLNINLLQDMFKLNDEKFLKYDYVSFAISTMVPNFTLLKTVTEYILSENISCKIHFSLHHPDDKSRLELIPSASGQISEILAHLSNYNNLVKDNHVIVEKMARFHRRLDPSEIHYTLIDGINAGKYELDKVISLLKDHNISIKFLKFSDKDDLSGCCDVKSKLWISSIKEQVGEDVVSFYDPPGRKVGSSCGQFTMHYYLLEQTDEERRDFEAWKEAYQIYPLKKNNILNRAVTYLAGPIDNADDAGSTWRKRIRKKILENNVGLYVLDPTDKVGKLVSETTEQVRISHKQRQSEDWDGLSKRMKQIVRHDLRQVDISDFIIAKINPDIHSCGTYAEIQIASLQKKPILLICDQGKENVPLWLFGIMDHNCMFNSEEECIEYLCKVNSGEIELSDKWVLIRNDIKVANNLRI